jgi:hypothetical protein
LSSSDTNLSSSDTNLTGSDTDLTGSDTDLSSSDTDLSGCNSDFTSSDSNTVHFGAVNSSLNTFIFTNMKSLELILVQSNHAVKFNLLSRNSLVSNELTLSVFQDHSIFWEFVEHTVVVVVSHVH